MEMKREKVIKSFRAYILLVAAAFSFVNQYTPFDMLVRLALAFCPGSPVRGTRQTTR